MLQNSVGCNLDLASAASYGLLFLQVAAAFFLERCAICSLAIGSSCCPGLGSKGLFLLLLYLGVFSFWFLLFAAQFALVTGVIRGIR
jgi:hypothetical protein